MTLELSPKMLSLTQEWLQGRNVSFVESKQYGWKPSAGLQKLADSLYATSYIASKVAHSAKFQHKEFIDTLTMTSS